MPFGTSFSSSSLIFLSCVSYSFLSFGSAGILYLLPIGYASQPHLRILSLTTCVGSRYGYICDKFRSFSWKHGVRRLRLP